MAYQVLARKWRPQDFSSVVGQQPIVTALRNALTEGRIAQAYLFSGIRGVGKTSVARILAKALNCEKGPAADPCNECVPCREITASADLDVHEVDAATHSKVEQVRDLTEGLKYSPARDRYKVIIIDEIHRLSRQAFDALLKIVEEPPPHLVFIFATTEAEAVPVTVLSRCQEFRFRRVPSRVLAEHLRRIADAEGLTVGDKALRLIARGGDGSVRDSVALLDQLATFGSGTISDDEAARVLGGLDGAVFERLLGAMVGGDPATVSAIVADIEGLGWDPRHAYGEFLTYCRDALHLALGGDTADVDLPEEESGRLSKLAGAAGYENLLRLLHLLLESENTVRRSEAGLLALEICWLRAAELPKLVRVEEILGGRLPGDSGAAEPAAGGGSPTDDEEPRLFGGRRSARQATPPEPPPSSRRARADRSGPTAPTPAADDGPDPSGPRARPPATEAARPGESAGGAAAESPESEPPESESPESESPEEPRAEPAEPGEATAAREPAGPTGTTDEQRILDLLTEVSRLKQPLAAHLREARGLAFEDGVLRIYAAPGDPWLNQRSLQRDSNHRALGEALRIVFGEDASWKVVERETPPAVAAPAGTEARAADEVLEDPRVQKVLDIFGGHIESVVES